MDPNIEYSGIPTGSIVVGSIAKAKTYRYELRDPATGKYAKGPGTLKQNYPITNNPNTGPQQAQRTAFANAMTAWKALSEATKQTYRDRATQIRKDHPSPLNKKSGWLGVSLFISENIA